MLKVSVTNLAATSFVLGSVLSASSYAGHHESGEATAREMHNDVISKQETVTAQRRASDAWREGKLDTIYLFNRHLNNFLIDPEVKGNSVVLTGEVESEVDSELAEQLARGMDGITQVSNRLAVVPSDEERNGADEADRTFSQKVEDATLTAEIKTTLLANSETSGLSINVDTHARNVTLKGSAKSAAEKDLAGEIAKQVDGVASVENNIEVENS